MQFSDIPRFFFGGGCLLLCKGYSQHIPTDRIMSHSLSCTSPLHSGVMSRSIPDDWEVPKEITKLIEQVLSRLKKVYINQNLLLKTRSTSRIGMTSELSGVWGGFPSRCLFHWETKTSNVRIIINSYICYFALKSNYFVHYAWRRIEEVKVLKKFIKDFFFEVKKNHFFFFRKKWMFVCTLNTKLHIIILSYLFIFLLTRVVLLCNLYKTCCGWENISEQFYE